jgi:ferredoxin
VGAIDRDRPTVTDGKLCTFCCACIRVCPENARKLTFEPMVAAAKKLHENCAQRREPEVFFAG